MISRSCYSLIGLSLALLVQNNDIEDGIESCNLSRYQALLISAGVKFIGNKCSTLSSGPSSGSDTLFNGVQLANHDQCLF